MPNITKIKFFSKTQITASGHLLIAQIFGDENQVIAYLNELVEERRRQLIKTFAIPRDCANCSDIFFVNMCRKGKFLFWDSCCGIRSDLFTLTEFRGHLSYEFDN